MVVQHNLTAMNSNRQLGITTGAQAKSTEKLSSGYKINRAADDAAGLSISEKMRKQIRGLTQASANAQDGISAVQTAEGALTEVHDMLQRMNELAVKAANGTMSTDDRNYIQAEVDQLVSEIDRVATTTKFNETYLLKGDAASTTSYTGATVSVNGTELAVSTDAAKGTASVAWTPGAGQSIVAGGVTFNVVADTTTIGGNANLGKTDFRVSDVESLMSAVNLALKNSATDTDQNIKSLTFDGTKVHMETFANDPAKSLSFALQVGADSYSSNQIKVDIKSMSATGLGINGLAIARGAADTTTDETLKAREAIDKITIALQKVSTQRSSLGAAQNRLEHTISNLDNVVENTTAAEAAIRDTDMATEMVKYSNNQILMQAGQSMLAQANQANQGVLSLLQ